MADATSSPTSVYKYYDDLGLMIYVGVTSRGIARNMEHNSSKDWWPYVKRQEVEHFPNREQALLRESILITRLRPPFNKQLNPYWRTDRAEYLHYSQVPLSAGDAFRAYGKRIPLQVHKQAADSSDGMLHLVLPVAAGPLMSDTSLDKSVRVIDPDSSVAFGRVVAIRQLGPSFCLVSQAKHGRTVGSACADFKMVTRRGGRHEYRVHRVFAEQVSQ